jgi:hypothetical protein
VRQILHTTQTTRWTRLDDVTISPFGNFQAPSENRLGAGRFREEELEQTGPSRSISAHLLYLVSHFSTFLLFAPISQIITLGFADSSLSCSGVDLYTLTNPSTKSNLLFSFHFHLLQLYGWSCTFPPSSPLSVNSWISGYVKISRLGMYIALLGTDPRFDHDLSIVSFNRRIRAPLRL